VHGMGVKLNADPAPTSKIRVRHYGARLSVVIQAGSPRVGATNHLTNRPDIVARDGGGVIHKKAVGSGKNRAGVTIPMHCSVGHSPNN